MGSGTLRVSFDASVDQLGEGLPVEVRDESNVRVARVLGELEEQVPAGLYTVQATLPGGARHEQVVAVTADEVKEVVVRHDRSFAGAESLSVRSSGPELPLEPGMVDTVFGTAPGQAAMSLPALVEAVGCAATEAGPCWVVTPEDELVDTPYAVFELDGHHVSTSAPVNPFEVGAPSACVVTVVSVEGRARLLTSFAPERPVPSTVEGLLRRGTFLGSPELVDRAAGLLESKFVDPSAAALGGLILHRVGRLADRTDWAAWTANLANGFPWIPDGRVLLAATLAEHPDAGERARGLDLLVEAAGHRLLFTDAFGLLLDLLRRWPDDAGADARAAALAVAAPSAALVDWDAVSLTLYHGGGEP